MHRSDRATEPLASRRVLTRRLFVRHLSVGFAGVSTVGPVRTALGMEAPDSPRSLSFHNTHTDESLQIEYWKNGTYQPDALRNIDLVLRDHRTGDVHPIERQLLDLLHRVATTTGTGEPFEVISGYRSPETNEILRRNNPGKVSRNSFHVKGRAIDIRLPDVSTSALRDAGIELEGGASDTTPVPTSFTSTPDASAAGSYSGYG